MFNMQLLAVPDLVMPKRAHPDDARARIVAAARLHFFAHGFRGVSMDDLASMWG